MYFEFLVFLALPPEQEEPRLLELVARIGENEADRAQFDHLLGDELIVRPVGILGIGPQESIQYYFIIAQQGIVRKAELELHL